MSGRPIQSRTFERALRGPLRLQEKRRGAALHGDETGEGDARKFFYARLMEVSVLHDYYNRADFACPDFILSPTPSTAALMTSLGLLFKTSGTGFTVLFDEKRRGSLENYLRQQGMEWERDHPGTGKQVWARLSFLMLLKNPYFVNVTDISINTNPSVENFYFTNQDAHGREGRLILNRGSRVTDRQLLAVGGVQLAVEVSREVMKVVVRAVSGAEVLCKPRCVPRSIAKQKRPDLLTCDDLDGVIPGEEMECTDVLYLDFSLLPEDRYTVEKVAYDGVVLESWDVLYTASFSESMPLGFIDLFFTSPKGEKERLYPVRNLFTGLRAEIVPTHYTLQFKNRETLWSYYIVPSQPDRIADLRIESEPAVEFAGPGRVLLPNGRTAFRFVSQTTIPLQQQSEYRFRLWGRNLLTTHESVLVDRLPVASSQVLPLSKTANYSDIYVYV